MKWKCNSCDHVFEAPPGKNGWFDFGAPRCPKCEGEDVDQLEACDLCGTEWPTERLTSYGKLYICPGCKAVFNRAADDAVTQIRQYSRGRRTTKEIRDAFADYMDE